MRIRSRSRAESAQWVSVAYVVLFSLVHSLFFHDKFYDINRSKYYLFLCTVYPVAGLVGLLRVRSWWRSTGSERPLRLSAPAAMGMAFTLSTLLSASLSADPVSAFTGADGRFAGALFWIGCVLLFFLARCAFRRIRPMRLLALLCVSGSLCAALGVLNFFGIDPLRFYDDALQGVYRNDFISTIGNINFFSAAMCVMAGISVASFCYVPRRAHASLWLLPLVLSTWGLLVGRSESGVAGLACLYVALCLFGLRTLREAARGCVSLAVMGLSVLLLCLGITLWPGEHMELYEGVSQILLSRPCPVAILSAVFAAAAAWLYRLPEGEDAQRTLARVRLCLCALAAAICLAVCAALVFFTVCRPDIPLPGLLSYLRMDDLWGTFRGFIWKKVLSLYREMPWISRLFGIGPDTLKALLVEHCYDDMMRLTGILFDNAHNEYLQTLLTMGAIGLTSYLTLAGYALYRAWRLAAQSLSARVAAVALLAHMAQATFNIAQPETTPAVFLLLAVCICACPDQNTHSIR